MKPPDGELFVCRSIEAATFRSTVLMEFIAEFIDGAGARTGEHIALPVTTTTSDLNALVNQLLGTSLDPTPYSFYVEDNPIVDSLASLADSQSAERVLRIIYRPEAAFGVRAVSYCSAALPGHSHTILCIAFSNSGLDLATGGGDGAVIFWDVSTQAMLQRIPLAAESWVQCISWHQDGDVVAIAGTDGFIRILARNGLVFVVRNEFRVSTSPVFAIEWEPLHRQGEYPRIAASTKGGEVGIWCSVSGRASVRTSGHQGQVMGLAWGCNGVIFSGSHDRTVKAWDAASGAELAVFQGRSGAWRTLAISTGWVLRTGGWELGNLIDYDSKSGALKRLAAHRSQSPIEMIAVGGEDFTVSLLRYEDRKFVQVERLTGHTKAVNHIAFSPNGYWLATASFDCTVKLFDGKSGHYICTLGKGRGRHTDMHVGPVYRLAWSADSGMLISGSSDTKLKVWEITHQKLLMDFPGHENEVYGVDWSPAGSLAASGGKDKIVRLWM
jgi:ribosome assembly protein 4